jgi:hypothetical protein
MHNYSFDTERMIQGTFSTTRDWLPLFKDTYNSRDRPDEMPTIQEELTYTPIPREFVIEAQSDLENTLKLEVRKWRSKGPFARVTTSFDQEASRKLGQLLEPFERVAQGIEGFNTRDHERCDYELFLLNMCRLFFFSFFFNCFSCNNNK